MLAKKYHGKKLRQAIREKFNDKVLRRMMDNLYEDEGINHILAVMTFTRASVSPKVIADAATADRGRVSRRINTNDVIDLVKDFEKVGDLQDRLKKIQGYGLLICKKHKKKDKE